MRILYQRELLKEFEKQKRYLALQHIETEKMKSTVQGVFPEIVGEKEDSHDHQ